MSINLSTVAPFVDTLVSHCLLCIGKRCKNSPSSMSLNACSHLRSRSRLTHVHHKMSNQTNCIIYKPTLCECLQILCAFEVTCHPFADTKHVFQGRPQMPPLLYHDPQSLIPYNPDLIKPTANLQQ